MLPVQVVLGAPNRLGAAPQRGGGLARELLNWADAGRRS